MLMAIIIIIIVAHNCTLHTRYVTVVSLAQRLTAELLFAIWTSRLGNTLDSIHISDMLKHAKLSGEYLA